MAEVGKTGFFARLLGRATSLSGADAALAKHLAFLDGVETGLARKAAVYVHSGEGRPVLATLAAREAAIRAALQPHLQGTAGGRMTQIVNGLFRYTYSMQGKPEIAARLVEVLPLALPHWTPWSNKVSDDVPRSVKTFADIGNSLPFDFRAEPGRLTLDDILATIEELGGRPADLIELTMAGRYNRYLDRLEDRATIEEFALSQPPAEVIAALARMDAASHTDTLKVMIRRRIAGNAAFREHLLEAAAAGSAALRDTARAALMAHDRNHVTARAEEGLSSGKAAQRAAMVQLLGDIGTPAALDILTDHRSREKTQKVVALIDQFIAIAGDDTLGSGADGYTDTTGAHVAIPPRLAMPDDPAARPFGADDVTVLAAIDARLNERQAAFDARRAQISKTRVQPAPPAHRAKPLVEVFNGEAAPERLFERRARRQDGAISLRYLPNDYEAWILQALDRVPTARAIRLCLASVEALNQVANPWRHDPFNQWLCTAMQEGRIELRNLLDMAQTMDFPLHRASNGVIDTTPPADYHRQAILNFLGEDGYARPYFGLFGAAALWPALAPHLDLLIERLPPRSDRVTDNLRVLECLGFFPALPQAAVQPALFAAIGEARSVRTRARALLADVPGLDDQLIETLGDKRQAIRANAAAFLAQRGACDALPALQKRLKTEKSESARAEMISAVSALGGDTAPYLGQKALLAEARKLAEKLPGDALDWLGLSHAPALEWQGGGTVDPVIPEAWIKLAVKLKSPGGSALFALYLDQLTPASAQALSDWLLHAWIAHDSWRRPRDEMLAKVMPTAQSLHQGPYYKHLSVDEIAAMLLRQEMQSYPNSGSDTKGLLALTHRADPTRAARSIGGYLKDHGRRVAQARALVEVLAGMATPEAIQVLVATSTRFKQRTVREQAEALVTALAEARGWTADQLADRSIPTGGLDDGGVMELEIGEDGKVYTVRLGSDLALRLYNPAGKEVKSLPAGKDASTKEAKSLLSGAKKTIKTVTAQQQTRLYEAMLANRRWALADWRADLAAHPLMARLTERLVWRGLDEGGDLLTTFRPTPEGDLFTADGDDADLTGVAWIDLAHTATLPPDQGKAWLQHLADFEVAPLFGQMSRPVVRLSAEQETQTEITDREGWLMEALKLRSATDKLGYERGSVEDGAGFMEYVRTFKTAGIRAEIGFTGSYVPEDNIPVALTHLRFFDTDARRTRAMPLGKVPPLLLSECWNDWHDIAAKGAYDPDWKKKGLYT